MVCVHVIHSIYAISRSCSFLFSLCAVCLYFIHIYIYTDVCDWSFSFESTFQCSVQIQRILCYRRHKLLNLLLLLLLLLYIDIPFHFIVLFSSSFVLCLLCKSVFIHSSFRIEYTYAIHMCVVRIIHSLKCPLSFVFIWAPFKTVDLNVWLFGKMKKIKWI